MLSIYFTILFSLWDVCSIICFTGFVMVFDVKNFIVNS